MQGVRGGESDSNDEGDGMMKEEEEELCFEQL